MAQINVERNANESFIAREIQSYFFFKGGLRTGWNCAFLLEWAISMPEALGQVVLSARWTHVPAGNWSHRGAWVWAMVWISWHRGFGVFREKSCSERVPSGHKSSWTSPPTANTTLHMDLPVLQWALRAAVETSPGVCKHYCMESHELLRRNQGDYSCTGFQTTWKGLFNIFTVILCTLLLLQ